MKNNSILSIVLFAASAVVATLIPSKKTTAAGQLLLNGHMTFSTGFSFDRTCREPWGGDVLNCSYTQTGNDVISPFLSSTSGWVVGSNSLSADCWDITMSETEPERYW
jgi:hypothetical protein